MIVGHECRRGGRQGQIVILSSQAGWDNQIGAVGLLNTAR